MKKKFIVFITCILLIASFLQIVCVAAPDSAPPANCISIDNGTNAGALGFTGGGTEICVNRMSGFTGKTLSDIWFYYGLESSSGQDPLMQSMNLLIYSQDSGTLMPKDLLYSQAVDISTLTMGTWNCVTLDTSYAAQEDTLFVGFDITCSAHEIVIGVDSATDGGTNSFAALDLASLTSLSAYNFPSNYMIRAEYIEEYDIIIAAMTNGAVASDKTTAASGETVTLNVTPADGYQLVEGSLKFNDTAVTGSSFTMPDCDVTITAEFELIPRDITIADMTNGSVAADKAIAAAGETITLTITPDDGYQLVEGSLKYNDIAVTGTSFTMPACDVTITAVFELIPRNITIADMTNGSVGADKTVTTAGDTVTLTLNPADGYQLVAGSLKFNDTAVTGTSFIMPACDVTITAEFERIPRNITIADMANGSVKSDKATATAGETVTLTVTPKEGYRLVEGSLKCNDTVITGSSFVMPDGNVTITAKFERIPAIIDRADTGDTFKYGPFIAVGLVSLACLTGVIIFGKKSRNKPKNK